MLSCLSFMSLEKYGSEEKNKNPDLFLCQQSISWQWSVCAGGWEGSPWTWCPCWVSGGRWRHMEVPPSPGVSQTPSNGVCVSAVGRVKLGRQPGCPACWGTCVTVTRRAQEGKFLFLWHLECVSYCHHLSAATLALSHVQCACRGSSQEPNFSVPFICEFSLIIFMIFLRGLLVFY